MILEVGSTALQKSNPGAKRLKTLLAAGDYRWMPGNYVIPKEWRGRKMTELRRQRLEESIRVAGTYLRTKKTVIRLAKQLGVTHQRVVQIIERGVDYLLGVGRIRPVDKL